MANAFIAISDDGTAASWNPAGLGQLRRPELSLVSATLARSFGGFGFRTRDDLAVFSPVRSSYQSTFLEFASLAVPVTIGGKPVTFQAAWRRLYTLDNRESVSTDREPLVPEGPPALRIDGKPGPTFFRQFRQDSRVDGESLSGGLLLTYPRWSAGLLYLNPLHSELRTASPTASSSTSRCSSAGPTSATGVAIRSVAAEREVKRTQLGLLVRRKGRLTPEQQARLRELRARVPGR